MGERTMAESLHIAEKVALKAQKALEPLLAEMVANKWPADFRKIMWGAVADTARALARDAETRRPTTHKGERG